MCTEARADHHTLENVVVCASDPWHDAALATADNFYMQLTQSSRELAVAAFACSSPPTGCALVPSPRGLDEGRTAILPHPILVYMEDPYIYRK